MLHGEWRDRMVAAMEQARGTKRSAALRKLISEVRAAQAAQSRDQQPVGDWHLEQTMGLLIHHLSECGEAHSELTNELLEQRRIQAKRAAARLVSALCQAVDEGLSPQAAMAEAAPWVGASGVRDKEFAALMVRLADADAAPIEGEAGSAQG